jgi:acyl-CoA thioesterase-1
MHKIVVCFIVAALTLVSVGCKERRRSEATSPELASSAAEPPPAPLLNPVASETLSDPNRVPTDRRPLLVCFGDSLTAGYGADEGASYPDYLQKDLDQLGYSYHVLNEGISGNTTKDGVDRLPEIERLKPAVVVLEFGGNDGLRGLKVETTKANLATMITGLKRSGAKVVLAGITLPPDYGPDYVNAFTANYASLAKTYHVPLLPFLLENVYGVPGMMQADRTHATDQGNAIVAKNVLALLKPVLTK